jgi:hypothetical protein
VLATLSIESVLSRLLRLPTLEMLSVRYSSSPGSPERSGGVVSGSGGGGGGDSLFSEKKESSSPGSPGWETAETC